MAYNNANYVSVAERLAQATPDIQSIDNDAPVMLSSTMGYIRSRVTLTDGRWSVGTASFRLDLPGKGAQATNPIEDCETSAVGRALALLGYQSSRSIASSDEVQEARRREQEPTRQQAPAAAPVKADFVPPKDAAEARTRFFHKYGEQLGGTTWKHVQDYIGNDLPQPSTIEGWMAAVKAVREAAVAKQAEYDAMDKAAA